MKYPRLCPERARALSLAARLHYHSRLYVLKVTLDEESTGQFRYAVQHQYWYQMFFDDLPIWGMVGESGAESGAGDELLFIYTHSRFDIGYNGDRIIQVNLTAENPRPISKGTHLDFSYEVQWKPVTIPFAKRFERYLRDDFLEGNVHWFSLINSVMMVLFLTAMVMAVESCGVVGAGGLVVAHIWCVLCFVFVS